MRTTFLLLILFAYFNSNAQYATPGTGVNWSMADLVSNSNGTVLQNNDTLFTITANLTISQNDTLSFYDGIYSIICNEDVLITVNGIIQTVGDTSNPENIVRFYGEENNYFTGFKFENSTGSYFNNLIVIRAGGIKFIESQAVFKNCYFDNFNMNNSTGTVDLFKSDVELYNCTFYNNEGPGVKSASNAESSPKIYNCSFEHNVTSNINMPQINLGTSAEGDTIIISGCTITGDENNELSGGIAVSTLAGGELNCIIKGNTIKNNRYGIAVYGNNISSVIKNNVIENNTIQNDPMQGGSGISYWGNTTNVSLVSGNIIRNNLWGITIINAAIPDLGDTENNLSPGENQIYNNGNNGLVYDVYNNTPNDIKAENNYWGTDNADSIEAHIYHHNDDPALGTVDFIPFIINTSVDSKSDADNGILQIYPLPAHNFLYLKSKNNTIIRKIRIVNLSGQTVLNKDIGTKTYNLDVLTVQTGVYILTVYTDDKTISRKITIK